MRKPGASSEERRAYSFSKWLGRELYGYLDICVLKGVCAVHTHDFCGLDACKLASLLGKCDGAREIKLHDIAGTDRRGHWHGNECSAAADIDAVGVKKAVCLRQPDAYGPLKVSA